MAIITADAARERLHHIIDEIEDTRVINLYEFLKDEDDAVEDFVYTGEVKARLAKVRDDVRKNRKLLPARVRYGSVVIRCWLRDNKKIELFVSFICNVMFGLRLNQ